MRKIVVLFFMMMAVMACDKPSRVAQYRAEKHAQDSIRLEEQQRSLVYYESQLEPLTAQADSLLPLFKYEKNEKYQDHGFYVLTGRNGVRILVRDDGHDLLIYKEGKRIETINDPQLERAEHLQIVIRDIKECEKRIARTSLEVQKYEKRLQKQ